MPACKRILLVEDNPADIRLFRLQCNGAAEMDIVEARDGMQAFRVLGDRDQLFDLILLDLNLPGASGFEVLAAARSSSVHHRTPVVVLSSSEAARDVQKAYSLGASCYVQKPTELDDYTRTCSGILSFWFHVASLPARSPESCPASAH